MNPQKVLIVTAGAIVRGGVETFLKNWITYSPEGKFDYTWYHPQISSIREVEDEFRKQGVTLFCGGLSENLPRSNFFLKRTLQVLSELKKKNHDLRIILGKQKFNIVHVNTGGVLATMIALWQAKRAHVKIRIAHSHSTGGASSSWWSIRMARRFSRLLINKNVTRRVACSKEAAEALFGGKYVKETILVKNYVDTRRFAFSAEIRDEIREKLSLEDYFVIGQIARLSKEKNQKFLIDVFRAIYQRNPFARLLLVGDGPLKMNLKVYADQLQISNKIIFVGNVDNPQDYYQAMDLFILPSIFEGFPIVGIEAQTAGLPCVFSDAVTTDVDIFGYSRFLPLSMSPEEWADKIIEFSRSQKIDRAAAWKYMYDAGYDVSNVAQTVSDIYREG